jgi:hypothetical protein
MPTDYAKRLDELALKLGYKSACGSNEEKTLGAALAECCDIARALLAENEAMEIGRAALQSSYDALVEGFNAQVEMVAKLKTENQQLSGVLTLYKGQYSDQCEFRSRDQNIHLAEIAELKAEIERHRTERDLARQPINGQHTNIDDCPTFYDGCNCNLENLVHNINRAEKAEADNARLTGAIATFFNYGNTDVLLKAMDPSDAP